MLKTQLQASTKVLSPLDVLTSVLASLTDQSTATTIIVCMSKPAFLSQLQTQITRPELHLSSSPPRPFVNEVPSSQDEENEHEEHTDPTSRKDENSLLIPTLSLLSYSRRVRVAFCPSTTTLRAYIATLPSSTIQPSSDTTTTTTTTSSNLQQPLRAATNILFLNAVSLHRETSEFTVQGLSRTFAGVASLAALDGVGRIKLIECRDPSSSETENEAELEQKSKIWDAEVPLLSGGVKLNKEGSGWIKGRTVGVRAVVGRWFRFDQDGDEDGED